MGLIYPRAACDAPHDPHLPKLSWHGADSLSWRCLSHVVLGLGQQRPLDLQRSGVDQALPGHEVQNPVQLLHAADAHQTTHDHMRSALLQRQNLLRERERERANNTSNKPRPAWISCTAYKHANERKVHTHTHTHTHTLSLSYTHTHTLSLSHTHTHSWESLLSIRGQPIWIWLAFSLHLIKE